MMAGGRLKRLTEAGEGEGDRHLKLSFSESNLCLRLTMQLRTTHWAFVSDDLREKQMHLSTGGKFPLMRNTIWRWEKYSDHDFIKITQILLVADKRRASKLFCWNEPCGRKVSGWSTSQRNVPALQFAHPQVGYYPLLSPHSEFERSANRSFKVFEKTG